MVSSRPPPVPGRQADPVFLRKAFVLPGLVYPLWHLLAPRSAVDPWLVWWLIGGSFVLVGLLSRWSALVNRHLWDLFMLCTWLVTAQLFVAIMWLSTVPRQVPEVDANANLTASQQPFLNAAAFPQVLSPRAND